MNANVNENATKRHQERSTGTAETVEELQERVSEVEEAVATLQEEAELRERRTREESVARDEFLRADLAKVREVGRAGEPELVGPSCGSMK